MGQYYLNNDLNKKVTEHRNPIIRWVLLIGGFVLIGIGVLGMFLPLLPTTIFFLLAAWCFARSSQKFHHWLHSSKILGRYIANYRSNGGMTVGSKVFSISFLLLSIIISVVFLTDNLYIRILLAAIAVGVTWHLIAIKTISKDSSD